jgi:hypothetical protein
MMKLSKKRYPHLRSLEGGGFDRAGNRRYSGQELADCVRNPAMLDFAEATLVALAARQQMIESGDEHAIAELRLLEAKLPYPLGLIELRRLLAARARQLAADENRSLGGQARVQEIAAERRAVRVSVRLKVDDLLVRRPELNGRPIRDVMAAIREQEITFDKAFRGTYSSGGLRTLLKQLFSDGVVRRLARDERERLKESEQDRERERNAQRAHDRAGAEAYARIMDSSIDEPD